ncbi:MAG: MATE family efflux transporter [Verrucomicrobiales bacterium]
MEPETGSGCAPWWSADGLGLGFTSITATCFLLFNGAMAGWFLTDPATREMAAMLLTVSAAFQCSDALQILSGGALRGLNDVSVPAWIAVFAYWVISLPLGWWFAFPLHGGVAGIWWGITIGLTFTAVVLGGGFGSRPRRRLRYPRDPAVLDDSFSIFTEDVIFGHDHSHHGLYSRT